MTMRVFVTGASGFIGSALTRQLIEAGHEVTGLARSDASAATIEALGGKVHRGEMTDVAGVVAGTEHADAVIHLAFDHDFSKFADNAANDRRLIEGLGAALAGTGKPLIVTSGVLIADLPPGTLATEDSPRISSAHHPRAASEEAADAAAANGCDVRIVRLSQIHDPRRQGLITFMIALAREKGVVAYLGDGANRWAAAHVTDAARLYRLALEKGHPGAVYNAVGEEGVSMRAIADVLGRQLDLPVKSIDPSEAEAHFGWFAMFAATDVPASSEKTQRELGWTPSGPGLLEDLGALVLEDA
jgi:nucleoside-diphosphate-sugar epimerase